MQHAGRHFAIGVAVTALMLGHPGEGRAARLAPCAAAEHRQFDFWVGSWEVRTPNGKLAGTNRIERTLGGCVLFESWRGASGHRGHSYNIYDPTRHRWHQTWVDDSGLLLELNGGLVDGRMVLSGQTLDSTGHEVEQRITWERVGQENVRQHWESSTDGGATWSTVFDGLYRPKRAHERSPS